MGHSPTVLAREVVGMNGLRPIDDIVTLDRETGGRGKGVWCVCEVVWYGKKK